MSTRRTAIALALAAWFGLSPMVGAAEALPTAPAAPLKAPTPAQVPYLGVVIAPVPAALAAQLSASLPGGQGVMVREVEKESPAEKAGIAPYDVLLAYDDQKLFSPEQLTGLVRADKVGRQVKLHLLRHGQAQDVSVALGGREAGPWAEPLRMRDLRWSHHPGSTKFGPGFHENRGIWQEFDSLGLNSLGNGRYKASVDYLNDKGAKQHLEFEGTRDEIRRGIEGRSDIPVDERERVLQALELDESPWHLFPPFPWREFRNPGYWGEGWGNDWPH
jgi:hypothetical protein